MVSKLSQSYLLLNLLVERLCKGKFQDVLEFSQWMKQYYSINVGSTSKAGYDPVARRGHASDHPGTAGGSRKSQSSTPSQSSRSPRRPVKSMSPSAKPAAGSDAVRVCNFHKKDISTLLSYAFLYFRVCSSS